MDFITQCLLLILLAVPILYLFSPSKKQRRIAKYVNKLPGPLSLPIVGTTWSLIGLGREDLYKFGRKRIAEWGPLFRTWLGSRAQVVLMTPEHFEVIMNNSVQISKGLGYQTVKLWLGDGLLISTGAKWQRNRKLLTPAFHFKILDDFVEIFNEKAKYLVDQLDSKANGEAFDIFPSITHCALDIICETAMGIQVNAMKNGNSEYVKAIYDVSELAVKRILKPWLHSDLIYNNTNDGKRFNQCLQILHGFTTNVLNDKKKSLHEKASLSEEDILSGKKQRLVFLDLLLEASQGGEVFSDIEIRDEIDTFMFEGHDTTAAAMCWTLFLLGNNPNILKHVQDELEDVFHGEERNITTRDLGELKYLERVIKESLRLYPSVPGISRTLSEDTTIGGFLIPAGVTILLDIYELHRNPKVFSNPTKFDPDRFLPENSVNRHPYAYVPFSAGPRNCIGQKFAMFEEKTILAWILRKYKIKAMDTPNTIKILMEIILRPQHGLRVILEPLI